MWFQAFRQPEKTSTSSTATPATTSIPVIPTSAAQYLIEYVDASDVAATVSVNTHQNDFEPWISIQPQQNTDVLVNQIENYLKLILDNQINMTQTINVLMDNQIFFT